MNAVMQKKRSMLDLRIEAGFDTQKQLAEAAHLAESTVHFAESNKNISRKSAAKIVAALNDAFRAKGNETRVGVEDIDWIVSTVSSK